MPLIPQWGHPAAYLDGDALVLADRTANGRRPVEVIRVLEKLPKASEGVAVAVMLPAAVGGDREERVIPRPAAIGHWWLWLGRQCVVANGSCMHDACTLQHDLHIVGRIDKAATADHL